MKKYVYMKWIWIKYWVYLIHFSILDWYLHIYDTRNIMINCTRHLIDEINNPILKHKCWYKIYQKYHMQLFHLSYTEQYTSYNHLLYYVLYFKPYIMDYELKYICDLCINIVFEDRYTRYSDYYQFVEYCINLIKNDYLRTYLSAKLFLTQIP